MKKEERLDMTAEEQAIQMQRECDNFCRPRIMILDAINNSISQHIAALLAKEKDND